MSQPKFFGASFSYTKMYIYSIIICELQIRIYFIPVKITKVKAMLSDLKVQSNHRNKTSILITETCSSI